ncbi:MAG TPA: hypothetical protein VF707_14620 [Ardenticatenaceae bacterium]|jgi:hypothetical protein
MSDERVNLSLSLAELLIVYSALVHQEDSDVALHDRLDAWRSQVAKLGLGDRELARERASRLRAYIEGYIIELSQDDEEGDSRELPTPPSAPEDFVPD